ncbi:ShlB/FhaC/HecB family hemolysin secretion/activation protein [Sphingomonas xinjiangensis]|uniref:Hemolysin activation/secretion protein n=1 Tax=Sphingomonas xinjiangensis TaxID=643568 RepID=A0A840YDZ7_9SPHN|nr:hemolysin activation/secretion protein [Sphingomonas xinjiangensis]
MASGAAIFAGAISIAGLQALSPADFADLIAEQIGKTLATDQLASLASSIADRARSRGYAFASAWIGPQRLSNGVLTVSIDEGRVDAIRFDGPEQPAVRRALAALINGKPARLGDVERRLLIAGDVDGVRIRKTQFLREHGKGVLLVRVTQDKLAARVALSNEGTKPIGPEQLRLDVDMNALFSSDDAFTVTYSTTPAEPSELQYGRLRYANRVSADGTEVALVASGSAAKPGAYLEPLDLESRSWFVGAELLHPLWRRRDASLWLQAELGVRDLQQWRRSVRIRHDRIATARVSLYGYSDLAGGRLRVSTTLSQGFGIFGATRLADPLASRYDADATFTALSAWSEWSTELGGQFSLRLAAQSQLASQPLLITEETGLGGTGFLRGYDWSERSGDQGVMGLAELRYLWNQPFGMFRRAQLYVFLDGGQVGNLANGFGSGELASTGGGVRTDFTANMGANLEVAVPLTGARYDTDDETPKLNLRLIRSF